MVPPFTASAIRGCSPKISTTSRAGLRGDRRRAFWGRGTLMFGKRSWLRKIAWGLPVLGLAGWLAWSSGQALAQEPAAAPMPAKNYLNKTTITLPIVIDERSRSQLQTVYLWVKEGPTQPWKLCDKAPPTQTSFTFKAPHEGEYWFNLVSVDQANRMTPADVTKEAPSL